jgi:hypothetical protein
LTGAAELPDANDGMVVDWMGPGMIGGPVVYDPSNTLVSSEVDPNYGVGGLCSFGIHQQGGVSPTYLLDGGPDGGPLVHPVYGAIFNSTESYNGVTFFADADIPVWAQQALIWQWFYIGGSGALGHVFEPLAGSVADNDLLFFNYFRDADGDNVGDMTFVEAAYSAMPYLSWATIVVGDPLMRLVREVGVGPGWEEPKPCGSGVGAAVFMAGFSLIWVGGFRWGSARRSGRK